jgi:hypothetical protein
VDGRRQRRPYGLERHFIRRSSSCIRSNNGTSSKFPPSPPLPQWEELDSRALAVVSGSEEADLTKNEINLAQI